ncbi:unnamed protein product, partial [Thlaspi arvense]
SFLSNQGSPFVSLRSGISVRFTPSDRVSSSRISIRFSPVKDLRSFHSVRSSLIFTVDIDKSWISKPHLSQEYINGVEGFLDFAFSNSDATMLKSPCSWCSLVKYKYREDIRRDLMYHGFIPTYTNWHFHGEQFNIIETSISIESQIDNSLNEDSTMNLIDNSLNEDSTMNLLDDVFPKCGRHFNERAGSSNQPLNEEEAADQAPNSDERRAFEALLADANEELYEGCTSFSKLSFMLKLYHIKSITKISDKVLVRLLPHLLRIAHPMKQK